MKTVVYLDVLLLVNFVAGWFLLLAAGLLAGLRARLWRLALAAVLAALSALILLVPEQPYAAQVAYRLAVGAAQVETAFGWHGPRRFCTALAWYTAMKLLLAGLAMLVILRTGTRLLQTGNLAVYLSVSPVLLVGLSGGCWLGAELVVRLTGSGRPTGKIIGLELRLGGCPVRLRAALDTGCRLKDPITCLPVLLISYPDARARLPQSVRSFLDGWFAGDAPAPPPGLCLRLIPCTTANNRGVLPGFSVGDIGLIARDGVWGLGRTAVAFAEQPFGSAAYEALYGSDFL